MLRVYCFTLCLAIVSSLAINKKRQIGNNFENYEQHPAALNRDKSIATGRVLLSGPTKTTRDLLECNTKKPNDKCKQSTPIGGTFLTNLEGTSYGPGFPPKPVGLLIRPNASREEVSSTSAPEGRFLVDDAPPMPPPPLKHRPLPKGRLRRPLFNSAARQGLFQEDIDTMIIEPLFQEDLDNPKTTTQEGENSQGTSQENSNGSGEQNRAFLDSFNELDHPDPKLLSKLKGKLYQKLYAEKRNSELEGKEEHERIGAKNEEDESNEANKFKEDENSGKSLEEGPASGEEAPTEETYEDYESSKEEVNQDNSEEQHHAHHLMEEESDEEEQSALAAHPENSEEGKNQKEKKPDDSEEEGSLHPIIPAGEEGVDSSPLIKQGTNGSSENNRQNSSSSREKEGEESEETEGQNTASGEAVHSVEESNEDRGYSEENNIDSSAPSEDSEEVTYHLSEGVENDGSNESSRKPVSSSEDTNDIQQSSLESSEGVDEDYDSREPNSQEEHSQEHQSGEQNSQEHPSEERNSQEDQSEESPENESNEYDEEDEEKPTDYYDTSDYDNANPESEYEDMFPSREQEPTKKPQVYYKKRPATFYYIVGGPKGETKKHNKGSAENSSKPPNYEDYDKLKQSDSSTPSAEEQPSSSLDESFSSNGFDNFDLDSVLETPQVHDIKTTKSPVAVFTNTTPQTPTTKCDDNDTKKHEEPQYQKRLKTPLVTAKPNTVQLGDVVSFTRNRPINFGLRSTAHTSTSTFRPATISAIGIVKPGGSIIAKVVSPTLHVHSSTPSSPNKADDAQMEPPRRPAQVPWKTLLAAREATALTYLKPPPIGQVQTWFLRKGRTPRSVEFRFKAL